ncbi:facilitated trehalose transporter Tret1-like [Homalodisca vitripennis]|uniref:facilitated trehalose transporter Tret1-like n=1 Tax=Homalodisca vitripennis TaxID=197043 RepID=UPI001EEA3CE3|nr:facilitated trehalose transporter Tret1-like [Homalodisca vitripennis]
MCDIYISMGGLRRQIFAAFIGSISIISSGMAYGWVSPVLNQLSDEDGEIRATKEQISWIAADIEIGCLLTPLLGTFLMDKFGRKWPMLCAVPLFMISWILTLATRSVQILYIKRMLDGMGIGLVVTIAPIYLAEIAEANIRGLIIMSIAVTWYGGILIQFCLGTYLSYNVSAWINLVVPILYLILFSFLPESPYYFMMKKQENKAADSLAWFQNVRPNEVFEELKDIKSYLEEDAKNKESWKAVIKNTTYRKCLAIMIVVILATILTGLTTIFSYASEMFADTDSEGFLNPDTCSVAIATLFCVMSIVIYFLIDKIGRRPLIIVSAFGCFLSNLASAVFSYYKNEFKYKWIPLVTIGSYCFFVTLGLVPVMLVFQGELFPSSIRTFASGMIIVITTFVSLVALKLYYIIGSSIGIYVNYLIYAVVAGTSTVWLIFYCPETKNKTFAELLKELEGTNVGEKMLYREEMQMLNK